jgi:hypothetical protein
MADVEGSHRSMSSTTMARAIGAGFGLVFVLVNSGLVDSPWAWVLRVIGVAAFVVVLVGAWGRDEVSVQPRSEAVRVYWVSVALEAVALVLGSRLLADHGRREYGIAWVAFVVGFHFLPFARAFRTPSFLPLGLLLMALGLAGAGLGMVGAGDAAIALSAGVGSGLALLGWAGRPSAALHARHAQ